jgi:hypothetical protein
VQSFIYSIDYSCIIYIITPSHTLPLQNHLWNHDWRFKH